MAWLACRAIVQEVVVVFLQAESGSLTEPTVSEWALWGKSEQCAVNIYEGTLAISFLIFCFSFNSAQWLDKLKYSQGNRISPKWTRTCSMKNDLVQPFWNFCDGTWSVWGSSSCDMAQQGNHLANDRFIVRDQSMESSSWHISTNTELAELAIAFTTGQNCLPQEVSKSYFFQTTKTWLPVLNMAEAEVRVLPFGGARTHPSWLNVLLFSLLLCL